MEPLDFLAGIKTEIEMFRLTAKLSALPGLISWDEGYALMSLAATWPGEGDVVEIGSFRGRSTSFLAAGCKRSGRGRVIAVDHFRGSDEHQKGGSYEQPELVGKGSLLASFRKTIKDLGYEDQVDVHVGNSVDIGRVWSGRARMLFIDGDHSYQGVRNDFSQWEPHVEPYGLICFHDYKNLQFADGVTKFIDEDVMPSDRFMFVYAITSLAIFIKRG